MSVFPEAPAAERVIAAGRIGPDLPFVEFARAEIEQPMPVRFETQVARTPGGLAIPNHLVRSLQQRRGMVRPRVLAVFRLMTSSNFVGRASS